MIWSWQQDWTENPLSARIGGIVFGTFVALTAGGLCVSARAAPIYLIVLATTSFAFWFLDSRANDRPKRQIGNVSIWTGGHLPVVAFLVLAMLSAFWADDAITALRRSGLAALAYCAFLATRAFVCRLNTISCRHVVEGFWMGTVFGLSYLAIEAWTGQAIFRGLVNGIGLSPGDLEPARFYVWQDGQLQATKPDTLSRNFAPTTLILWPALYLLGATFTAVWKGVVRSGLFCIAVAAILASGHESSKFALVIGSFVFGLSLISLHWAQRMICVGWITACLFMVPIVQGLHSTGLGQADWLMASARARVDIWQQTAKGIGEAPWIGHGVRSMYTQSGPSPAATSEKNQAVISLHPHNLYLQVWYELGVLGSALLCWIGLSWLRVVQRFDGQEKPYILASLTSGATLLATSFGVWQTWLLCLIALTAMFITVLLLAKGQLMRQDGVSFERKSNSPN